MATKGIHVLIDENLHKRAKLKAIKEGLTFKQLIERLLKDWVKRKRRPTKEGEANR